MSAEPEGPSSLVVFSPPPALLVLLLYHAFSSFVFDAANGTAHMHSNGAGAGHSASNGGGGNGNGGGLGYEDSYSDAGSLSGTHDTHWAGAGGMGGPPGGGAPGAMTHVASMGSLA